MFCFLHPGEGGEGGLDIKLPFGTINCVNQVEFVYNGADVNYGMMESVTRVCRKDDSTDHHSDRRPP